MYCLLRPVGGTTGEEKRQETLPCFHEIESYACLWGAKLLLSYILAFAQYKLSLSCLFFPSVLLWWGAGRAMNL